MDIYAFMGGIIITVLLIMIVGAIAGVGLIVGSMKCARVLHCCSGVPSASVASRGYAGIVNAMAYKHADPDDRLSRTDEEKLKHHMVYDIYLGDADDGARSFIRLCHMVGLEIVIRPVNKKLKDIEKEPEEVRKQLRRIRNRYLREIGRR